MNGTSNKPLNPFRKQNTPSAPSNRLHSRWGDVSISVPTEGSWSQYDTSSRLTRHKKTDHNWEYGPEKGSHPARHRHPHPHPQSDDEDGFESTASTSTDTASTGSSRRNSILLNTLNPARHISMRRRLSSRPHPPHRHTQSHSSSHSPAPCETQLEDILDENEHLITEKWNNFAYKPIRQDYPSEVAESRESQTKRSHGHGQSQSQRQNPLHRTNTNTSTRFRYIPASVSGSRYREEFGEIPPRSQSACSGSGSSRNQESRYSLSSSSGVSDGLRYEHEHGRSRSKGAGPERGEKRLSFVSSKFLTTAMVPDPDDLYD